MYQLRSIIPAIIYKLGYSQDLTWNILIEQRNILVFVVALCCPNQDVIPKLTGTHQGPNASPKESITLGWDNSVPTSRSNCQHNSQSQCPSQAYAMRITPNLRPFSCLLSLLTSLALIHTYNLSLSIILCGVVPTLSLGFGLSQLGNVVSFSLLI